MFFVKDVKLAFGDRTLFEKVNIMITAKDRIGLIGANGAGKSTLLKIMAQYILPDEGIIEYPKQLTIGSLKQEFDAHSSSTIIEETMSSMSQSVNLLDQIDKLSAQIATHPNPEDGSYNTLLEAFAAVSAEIELNNPAKIKANAIKILKGLGFKDEELDRPVSILSGGWRMRVELAKLLLSKPEVLLLDEPTNHLDIESIIWFESYLRQYSGAVVVISHDQEFLEAVSNRIIELEYGKCQDYKLGYRHFLSEKEKQKVIQVAAYENQQKEISQKEKTIQRFMAKATKTSMAQSMQKQLDKVNLIEKPVDNAKAMHIRFAPVSRSGRDVVKLDNVSKSFDTKCVFSDVDLLIERGERVALVG